MERINCEINIVVSYLKTINFLLVKSNNFDFFINVSDHKVYKLNNWMSAIISKIVKEWYVINSTAHLNMLSAGFQQPFIAPNKSSNVIVR